MVDGHAVTQISKVERNVELYKQTGREWHSKTDAMCNDREAKRHKVAHN